MNGQRTAVTVVALVALAAAGYGIWRQTGGIRKASAGPVVAEAGPMMAVPRIPFSPGPPLLTPRLVATWTTRVGRYSVGVSSLRPIQDNRRLMGRVGFRGLAGEMGPFHLTLQILAEEEDVEGVELDVDSVRLKDDRGAVHRCDPEAPSANAPVRFPGGLGYVLPFAAPSGQATILKSVEGELILASGERRPFRIANVTFPLQRVTRLFGRLAPRRLSTTDEARLPGGLAVLQKEEAESVLRRSEPLDRPMATAPQRLVFAHAQSASVGIPTPLEPDPVLMTASAGPMGRMDLEIRHGDETWRGKLWDRETILLALPRRGKEARRAAAIRLSLDVMSNASPSMAAPTFMPEPGQPGGVISSKVLVGGRPFGQGVLQVEVRRLQGAVWSEARVTNVPVGRDGTVELPNLAPGTYLLRRPGSRVTPELPPLEPPVPLQTYLLNRFGVHGGRWTGEQVDRIEVRNGQRTVIEPLRLHSPDVKPH